MDSEQGIAWAAFLALILSLLFLDLFLFHRTPREIKFREALLGTILPIVLAFFFIGCIYFAYQTHAFHLGIPPPNIQGTNLEHFYPANGRDASILFLTGYIVELSLSADNVFLFVLLMSFFNVPRALQHRVLFWGVLGALIMRGGMILAGAALLSRFEWLIYLFGAFLFITGVRMLFPGNAETNPADNVALRLVKKILRVDPRFHGKRFFIRINKKWFATTLFLVLVCIEFTDLVFALDSIPAIFGITRDAFLVFTSNIFAILGLRSMYFLLANIMDKFRFLKTGLALVLAFVGIKMLLQPAALLTTRFLAHTPHHWEINEYASLAVIVVTLTASILASIFLPLKKAQIANSSDP